MYRFAPTLLHCALGLMGGMVLATLGVNLAPGLYYDAIEWPIADLILPQWIWAGSVTLTPVMIVSDMLMALFFVYIAKELWEGVTAERGILHGKRALLPVGTALGGLAGSALVWLFLSANFQTADEAVAGGGWQLPLGGDAIMIYFFARLAFGPRHPLVLAVLLIACLVDVLALLVLGLSQVTPHLRMMWLLLPLVAGLWAWAFFGRPLEGPQSERRLRARAKIWPYLLAGALSWFGTAASGMPAALGLLPILPAVAHARRSFGLFAEAEDLLSDPLNRLTRMIEYPLPLVAFAYGFVQGGFDLMGFTPTTLITLGALWVGRPLGLLVAGFGLLALLRYHLPPALQHPRDFLAALMLCAMGFSLPALALGAALPGGAMQEAARLGLALSLSAGPLAWAVARLGRR